MLYYIDKFIVTNTSLKSPNFKEVFDIDRSHFSLLRLTFIFELVQLIENLF